VKYFHFITVAKQQTDFMSKQPFDKFINKKPVGAKKKEIIRQEKKKEKREIAKKSDEWRKINDDKFKVVTAAEKKALNSKPAEIRNEKSEIDNRQSSINKFSKPKPAQRYKQGKPITQTYEQITQAPIANQQTSTEAMPLNKYIAHGGICGRREAALLVKQGKVTVNGDIVYEPGYKVLPTDKVIVKDKEVFLQKNLVYILVNKPKDYITTAKDPEGRKTIFDLLKNVTKERIFPVGRLDRNTTGVLLMTNDGELAQKLTHPSFEIKKLYEIHLDKILTRADFDSIINGITLEDGFVRADALAYADARDKSIIGVEIHSGRNRIVRRIFEHLGYKVKNLDRVMFANLTKKNVDRGKWRMLNEKEVRLLKFMNQSFLRKKK
jgi:23S rRNA pseudouridine2605 synthase